MIAPSYLFRVVLKFFDVISVEQALRLVSSMFPRPVDSSSKLI